MTEQVSFLRAKFTIGEEGGGKGTMTVWKGEPDRVWKGAGTRCLHATVLPQADGAR